MRWGMGLEGSRVVSVRLTVCRARLVVGIGAEVQYHDGGVGESINVVDWVGARLMFSLEVNGCCSFLSEGQYLGHQGSLLVPDFVRGFTMSTVPCDVVLKRCIASGILPRRVR